MLDRKRLLNLVTRLAISAALLAAAATPLPASEPATDENGNPIQEDPSDPTDRQGRVVFTSEDGEINYEEESSLVDDDFGGEPPPTSGDDLADASEGLVVMDEWHRSTFGTGIGATGMYVVDLDGNGTTEIVAGASSGGFGINTFWYILSFDGSGYAHSWVSPQYSSGIRSLRVADADGDGDLDVVIVSGREILVYDGETLDLLRVVPTTANEVRGLRVVDVDADGSVEFVFVERSALYIVDAVSGVEEYRSTTFGGYDVDVGNVDTDPGLEIVVGDSASTGYVLDGSTRAIEWAYAPGFGVYVAVGDLDGDGIDEIAGGQGWYRITVFNADLRAPAYEIQTRINIDALQLFDVENDGSLELVYGDGQWGSVYVHDGQSGALEWSIRNPDHGVTDVAVGDADDDGVNELLWGAGYSSTGADYLYVHDTVTQGREWRSYDISGPFFALDWGDVDDDGRPELLYGSLESDSGYGDGLYFIHDAETKTLEYQSPEPTGLNWTGLWRIRHANVDGDPQHEIFITTGRTYSGMIIAYDGITHEEQWRFTLPSGLDFRSMSVADVDLDGSLEIVAGTHRSHTGAPGTFLYLLDAATGAELWHSTDLGSYWATMGLLRVAQLDADPQPEIVIAESGGEVYVFDGKTRIQQGPSASLRISALDTADLDDDDIEEIVIGTTLGAIQVLRTSDLTVDRTVATFSDDIEGLIVSDVIVDGTPDFVFGSDDELAILDGSTNTLAWGSGGVGYRVGQADSIMVADIDEDGSVEITANIGRSGIRIWEIPEAQNHLPIAHAGPDIVTECWGSLLGTAQFDGSASTDVDSTPGTNDDIVGFVWSEDGVEIASGEYASAQLLLGSHNVRLTVTDAGGLSDRDTVVATVVDTRPPAGGIVEPLPGSCYGPSSLPVIIRDDFRDVCDPSLERLYGDTGLAFNDHGDLFGMVTAIDGSGNSASDSVTFTVDRISPIVELLNPPDNTWLLPTDLNLEIAFFAVDEDGASGGVLHERIQLSESPQGRSCTIYDGLTYGDQDGFLHDETLVIDVAEMCRLSWLCRFPVLERPRLGVLASDCGDNVGMDFNQFHGSLKLWPGLCGQESLMPPGQDDQSQRTTASGSDNFGR